MAPVHRTLFLAEAAERFTFVRVRPVSGTEKRQGQCRASDTIGSKQWCFCRGHEPPRTKRGPTCCAGAPRRNSSRPRKIRRDHRPQPVADRVQRPANARTTRKLLRLTSCVCRATLIGERKIEAGASIGIALAPDAGLRPSCCCSARISRSDARKPTDAAPIASSNPQWTPGAAPARHLIPHSLGSALRRGSGPVHHAARNSGAW